MIWILMMLIGNTLESRKKGRKEITRLGSSHYLTNFKVITLFSKESHLGKNNLLRAMDLTIPPLNLCQMKKTPMITSYGVIN